MSLTLSVSELLRISCSVKQISFIPLRWETLGWMIRPAAETVQKINSEMFPGPNNRPAALSSCQTLRGRLSRDS